MIAEAEMENTLTPLLTFSVGSQHYGLLIDEVIEVASIVELITVPEASPEILGVANRHGEALPMLDLRQVFGHSAGEITSATMFIVAVHRNEHGGERLMGLVVDLVNQVEYLESDKLQEMTSSGKYIRGIVGRTTGLVQILALPALFSAYLEDVRTAGQFFEGDQE